MKIKRIINRCLFNIPSTYRMHLKHKKAKKRFYKYMKRKLGDFMIEVDPGPIGSKDIILRTQYMKKDDTPLISKKDYYFFTGYTTMLSWLQHLEYYSFNIRTIRTVMELGCGSARLIRHLRCVQDLRLIGTDVKEDFIKWCKQNVPGVEFYVNDLRPPLSFAEDNSIDLVYARSVFTHIPLDVQGLWIDELYRIIRPGGYAILNVLGLRQELLMLDPEDQKKIRKNGHLTLDSRDRKASYATQLVGSWDVFQTRGEVLKAFGSKFHVCDYTQNAIVLYKSDGNSIKPHGCYDHEIQ